jgi:hypothetical protein
MVNERGGLTITITKMIAKIKISEPSEWNQFQLTKAWILVAMVLLYLYLPHAISVKMEDFKVIDIQLTIDTRFNVLRV